MQNAHRILSAADLLLSHHIPHPKPKRRIILRVRGKWGTTTEEAFLVEGEGRGRPMAALPEGDGGVEGGMLERGGLGVVPPLTRRR